MTGQPITLVTGAGGFIGHHLVRALVERGERVRGVDLHEPQYEASAAHEFEVLDLREMAGCERAVAGVAQVYQLAADMGGIGYIGTQRASIARNNSLINLHMLEASRRAGVSRLLFSSSACVYAQGLQGSVQARALREEDAFPADPERGYGFEKLYAEELCRYYREECGLDTRIVRFHNVYGPLGCYDGGREKAPAAICRKLALAVDGGEVEVWGDGAQTRSFMYIDDCVEGLLRIMAADYAEPLNLGNDTLISIDELVELVARIAEKRVRRRYRLDRPQGVRGRNSDNTRLREVLGWEPRVPLEEGLRVTYRWVAGQLGEGAERTRAARAPRAQARAVLQP
jgi:GDP-D-mannose 3',5'-epimerase